MPLQPARLRLWSGTMFAPVLIPILLLWVTSVVDGEEVGNNVVAVVNADPITYKTLADESLRRYGTDQLESMINRYLILQACKERGIVVSEADVRTEIEGIAKKFRLPIESYLALLQEERDISPNQYGREIVWPMLALRRLVADKIEVTEDEYNRAFAAQYGEAVKCRMMMVGDRQTAESLRAQALANPPMFEAIAKKFSEDETSASMGGLIPPIRHFTGDPQLEAAAFALQDGEISPLLELGDQWIVLQAVRRISASQPSPEALPAIKQQITDRLRDQKMKGAAAELFVQLQTAAQVVTVLGDAEASQKYPGVAAIVNGQQISIAAVANECVKQHGDEVLEGEINRKVLFQALKKAGKEVTPTDLQGEVAHAAIRFGYVNSDGSADLNAWIASVTSDGTTTREIYELDAVWPSVALKKLVEQDIVITEEDLQQGFESAFGPRVEVLALVLADQRSAQKIWEMARSNPTDDFFGQLASQYSIEPVSSSNFGKVPPIRKHGGQPAIEREAFQLKPGEMSGIIATGDQYVILRCQGFTAPIVTELSDVRAELLRDLTERKSTLAMAARFDQLKEAAQIDNFFEAERQLPRIASKPDSPAN